MWVTYKNTKIFYNTFGNGENLVVFLHGWGDGSILMQPLAQKFNNTTNLLIDFSPFGKSEEPKDEWTVFDYANLTKKIIKNCLKKQNYQTITLVGHSFGGRIAILLENEQFITNVVLIASAGLKQQSKMVKFKICLFKILKKFKIHLNFASEDYKKLNGQMKNTFKNIVNQDLSSFCLKFSKPCLIFAFKKDTQTPLKMQKRLHKLIKTSNIIVLKNEDHFGYLKNLDFVCHQIKIFCNFV